MRMVASLLSALGCLVSGWMFVMYLILRHPGFEWRAAIAALIFAGGAVLLGGRPPRALRLPIAAWGFALAALGIWGLVAPGDDAWASIAGLVFVAEGIVAIAVSIPAAPRAASR